MRSPLLDALDERLDAACADGGTVSVWLGDLEGNARYTRAADAPHYAASMMKLPLAVAALRRVARGELAGDLPVPVRTVFSSVVDGSPFTMDEDDDQDPGTWAAVGSTLTVRELVERAVTLSGNLATNLLVDTVGLEEVASVLRDAGCSNATVVERGIEDLAARAAGITNTVTAADLGVLLAAVARREPRLAPPSTSAEVEQILSRQVHRDQVPAGLPPGTWTANKTGWVTGVSHDACLVRPEGRAPFVLVVCTTIDLSQQDAARLVASVARDLWDAGAAAEPAVPHPGRSRRSSDPPTSTRPETP